MSRAAKTDDHSTPTLNAIESWESECIQIDATIKGLSERKSALRSLIADAKRLLPVTPSALAKPANHRSAKIRKTRKAVKKAPAAKSPVGSQLPIIRRVYNSRGEGLTWTGVIKEIVEKSPIGLSHPELREAVRKTPLGERLEASEKSYYGAVGKLADSKLLVRHNGRIYSPEALNQFLRDVAAGKAVDKPVVTGGQRSPMGEAVKVFLKTREFGAISGEISKELSKSPDFEAAIRKNKTFLYNVLARLIAREEVVKKGERYLLAKEELEVAA